MLILCRSHPHYRLAVVVTPNTERSDRSTYEAVTSLPASFAQHAILHLCIDGVDSPRFMLERCRNIINLSLNPARGPYFPFLEVMRLQRLATHIRNLLEDFTWEPLTHAVFANITHLTMFDDVSRCTWADWRDLQELPSLTHLCLNGEIAHSMLHGVLRRCRRLQILVNQWRDLEEIQPQDYCAAAGVADERFVMLETGEWVYEWELSARGIFDMWDQAKAFIAGKRNGAIPGMPLFRSCRFIVNFFPSRRITILASWRIVGGGSRSQSKLRLRKWRRICHRGRLGIR